MAAAEFGQARTKLKKRTKPGVPEEKQTMAKKTTNYLALDLGAESGRGIIGRFDGKTIELEEVYRFQHTPLHYQGSLRWDVLVMAMHLREALKAAVTQTRGRLASLGVDTWGVDYVFLDKGGDLLGYPFHYRDGRTDTAMPAAFKKVSKAKIFEVTGLQFLRFNTLYQLYADVLAKSGRLEAAKTMLFIPDFLSYTLGGDKTCEYTIASTSQMLDARKRAWAKPLMEKLGIPTGILPRIVMPGAQTGNVSAEIAAMTGAPTSMKIIAPGRHDTASAVAAVPHLGKGKDWAYISSGTWSLFGAELDRPILTPEVMRHGFTNEGGLDGTIRFLTNIMGLWIVQELRRAWTDPKGHAPSYAEMVQAAAEAKPFGPRDQPQLGTVRQAGPDAGQDRQVLPRHRPEAPQNAGGIRPLRAGEPGAQLPRGDGETGRDAGQPDPHAAHHRRRQPEPPAQPNGGRRLRLRDPGRPGRSHRAGQHPGPDAGRWQDQVPGGRPPGDRRQLPARALHASNNRRLGQVLRGLPAGRGAGNCGVGSYPRICSGVPPSGGI